MAQAQLSTHQIDQLESRHAELKAKVATLDCRRYLTPDEELELHRLKKEKLWTKDAIRAALF